MKVTKRELGIALILLGFAVVLLCWRFVYQKNMDEKTAVEAEIKTLQERESELSKLEENKPFYEDEIERMEGENAEIISHFPANVLPENEVMYAVELEENSDVYFTSLVYGSPTAITTSYEEKTGITAYDVPMSISYQSTYQGLKDAILYNKAQDNRMVINSVTASFDSTTGELTGAMTLDQYYMTGTENVYAQPYVPEMDHGMENIFGSMDIEEPEEALDVLEAVEAEDTVQTDGE